MVLMHFNRIWPNSDTLSSDIAGMRYVTDNE